MIGIKANLGTGEETFDPVKGYMDDEDVEVLTPKSSNTASTSDTTNSNDAPIVGKAPIVVTATPRKRSYGRLKKEIAKQDAVLKEYLMQQDKREAERDRKADEREETRDWRAQQRDDHWLTLA